MARKKRDEPVGSDPKVTVTRTRTVTFAKSLSETDVKRILAADELASNEALREAGVTVDDVKVEFVLQGYEDDGPEFISAELTVSKSEPLAE